MPLIQVDETNIDVAPDGEVTIWYDQSGPEDLGICIDPHTMRRLALEWISEHGTEDW